MMKHTYLSIPGWFNMHEAYDRVLDNCQDGDVIVEIGCFMGKSSNYLGTNIVNSGKDVTVFCVDTFEGSSEHSSLNFGKDFIEDFTNNCKELIDLGVLKAVRGRSDSEHVLSLFNIESVKGVIVDGAHEYEAVYDDVYNWYPKLKKDGIMVGDDLYMESVKQGCMKAFGNHLVEGVQFVSGREAWFAVKKDDTNHIFKMVPGQNCLT